MDPKHSKPLSKRVAPDPDQVPSCRPNRLFLSETIPPAAHQHQPDTGQNRSHNLSDRIHEYYEKLVKSSHLKKSGPSSQRQQFSDCNLPPGYGDPYLVECNPMTVPRFSEHPSIPVHSALQPTNSNVRQPYTVYVEDPSGVFEPFKRKQHAVNPSSHSYFDRDCVKGNEASSLMRLRESSSSSSGIKVPCSLCHSSDHSSQHCHLRSRIPAEHDGFFSDPLLSGGSPPTRHSKSIDDNQGDGSEDRIEPSFSKKRNVPANINVRCERDVIGQEKSPVSKSHPVGSGALSTSSSNGDSVPRERKKWVRPPLVGQAASSEKSPFMSSAVFDCPDEQNSPLEKKKTSNECLQLSSSTGSDPTDSRDSSKVFSQSKSAYFDTGKNLPQRSDEFYGSADREGASTNTCQQLTSEGEQGLSDSCVGGRVSPSSSVTSSRRLEWDSGADVGYNQVYNSANADASSSGLCTIERMALAQGCSVALQLRLDPEGTTVPASTSGPTAPIPPTPVQEKATPSTMGKPTAESTPLDQIPHIAKVILRYRNDTKNMVSPILHSQMKNGVELETLDVVPQEVEIEDEQASPSPNAPTSRSSDSQGTTKSFHRQLSNSMQDLRKCSSNQSGNQLLKSQSDPDLSGDTPTSISRTKPSKLLKGIMRGKNFTDSHAAGHSISSGSDATLVHVGTEEDLVLDADDNHHMVENPHDGQSRKSSGNAEEELSSQPLTTKRVPISGLVQNIIHADQKDDESGRSHKSFSQSQSEKNEAVLLQLKHSKNSSNVHICSDLDHKRGLHHHFGVLCSSILGGHVQSGAQPNVGSQIQNAITGPDRVYGFLPSCTQDHHQSREATLSPPPQEVEVLAGESTESSAFHSDTAHDDHATGGSALTGRVNSYEYLPGHMYENNPPLGLRNQERPPGISTSTETDSEPARPLSRAMHRKVLDSSSHDTEDDRLWASPRMGSNSLVQDIERGVNLLKGVMENKSAGRRCKRELIRRIIKKLVMSEYVEDVVEKERARHHVRSPFTPRKSKYQERSDRNIRLKRPVGPERQEISGESDEPKQRVPSVRRKLSSHQGTGHLPASRILSTLASGSKSSSLWSSQAESTSGSITLSGSSDNQKASKTSVKSMLVPHSDTADWLKPATQSEKLFEMRKNGASHADKHLAGLLGMHVEESVLDPMAFKNDPNKQLSWVTNEINQLKILKQLLQKQESLKQSLNPNLDPVTVMPVTGFRQTMQMADCTSPDAPESHSPKLKSARLQQWISLESDTSAGFGLSNHTGSSRDSHWRDVEVASAGEQDHHPHRTVSISDGDQITDASCSLSNRKSDVSQSSGPQIAHKSRRRSVSISDADQLLGPQEGSEIHVQKKRSDCQCQRLDGRTFSSRPGNVATYGPPMRNLASEKQVCQQCSSHGHLPPKDVSLPPGTGRSALTNRGFSSLAQPRFDAGLQQSNNQSQKPQPCTCGSVKTPIKKCCCSAVTGLPAQRGGAIKKGGSIPPQKMVSRIAAEPPSTSTQPLSGGGLVRVRIETDQEHNSAHNKTELQQSSSTRDRVRVADTFDLERASIVRPPSDDSITKAVTEAVSTKVKALRNLGQIEEAEVKIRVKVAPGQASSDVTPHSERGRVLKTQDLEDEGSFYPSKHSELDEIIAIQRARDMETRQKLLAIAETRQRTQMGLHDMDRRIQDLLLEDYLSRQFKTPEMTSTPHARLNVRVEAPVMQSSSVGIQSEVDKKTIGTSTSTNLERSPKQINQHPPQPSSKAACICQGSVASVKPPQSAVSQGQQTDKPSRPQTAPTSYVCSCRSQPASTPRTYCASPPYFSPERQVEFELELHKQGPYRMSPFEVHQTLKSKNTAYFLQFEEDNSPQVKLDREIKKPPMEVIKMKIPKQKQTSAQPSTTNRVMSTQGRKGLDKVKVLQKPKAPRAPTEGRMSSGASESNVELNLADHMQQSRLPESQATSGGANVLRITPGRSHLSISITDSSGESIPSPDGDSRHSSYLHPSRKPHRSSRSNKQKESIHIAHNDKVGDTNQTVGGRTEGVKGSSDASSASNTDPPSQSNRRPANDSESMYDYLGDHCNSVPTLQEYLEKNHPKYLDAAEKRRRCIAEMSYLRRLRQQSRKRLMELEGDNLWAKQKQQWKSRCASRPKPAMKKRSVPRITKSAYVRRYMFLPENQQRLAELKKKEEKRTNRLMAEIYTRKLQEKVLKGSATIRSSVSVISSL